MAQIIIPTPLRKFTNNESTFTTKGATVKEAIADLTTTHNGLAKHILDDQNNIRTFIRIYVGDDDINTLEKDATAISDSTVVSIIPAIAGGC